MNIQKNKTMKKYLFLTCMAIGLCSMIMGGCDGGRDEDNDKDKGYAPSSINGSEIIFHRNGEWNFKSKTQGGTTLVQINAEVTSIAYDKSDPECVYTKTGNNTAKYTLEFWHKAYVPYYQDYSYGYNFYSLTLNFTSPVGGTYTGTRDNGTSKEERTGTFTLSQ